MLSRKSVLECNKVVKMDNILSFSEIKEQFDSEWVLLENPETDMNLNIIRGRILYHSKDRDEVYRKGREIGPIHSAIIFTGQLPDNVAVIL